MDDALFSGWGDAAAARVRDVLLAGIAAGEAAAGDLAATLRGALEFLTFGRASTIARDAQYDAYREATLAALREADALIVGWVWQANLGTACAICTELHGSEHPVEEDFDGAHPNCQCDAVPMTRAESAVADALGMSAEDLALADLPTEASDYGERGAAWLARQDAAVQRGILGPGAMALIEHGDLTLHDLVTWRSDPVYGRVYRRRSLAVLRQRAQVRSKKAG